MQQKPLNAYTSIIVKRELDGAEADVIYALREMLKKEQYSDIRAAGAIADCIIEASKRFKIAKERYE